MFATALIGSEGFGGLVRNSAIPSQIHAHPPLSFTRYIGAPFVKDSIVVDSAVRSGLQYLPFT